MHDAVSDQQASKLQKLSNTLINITTENTLLKVENKGFKTALYNEKKRRKRGKHLFQFRAKDGGSATFFSPAKIQAALDFNNEQAKAKAIQKEQKDTATVDRKLQQQVK